MLRLILSSLLVFIISIQNTQNQTFVLRNFHSKTCLYVSFLLEKDMSFDSLNYHKFVDKLETWIASLQKKQAKKSWNSLKIRSLFIKTHRKFLKTYDFNASFSDMIQKGKYNCVTGSLLFSLILDRLDIKYEIRETPFHTYLKVWTAEKQCILLETTDMLNGFVNKPEQIVEMEQKFSNPYDAVDEYFNQDIFNKTIDLERLFALYFYNLGIENFNRQSHLKAKKLLSIAKNLYPEKRIVALYKLNESLISF